MSNKKTKLEQFVVMFSLSGHSNRPYYILYLSLQLLLNSSVEAFLFISWVLIIKWSVTTDTVNETTRRSKHIIYLIIFKLNLANIFRKYEKCPIIPWKNKGLCSVANVTGDEVWHPIITSLVHLVELHDIRIDLKNHHYSWSR